MRKNRINRITDWIGTGDCRVERGTGHSLYVFVLKSCLEPDRTLIRQVENCSPTQNSALNAVTGRMDFVSGSRNRGGDVWLSRSLLGGN
jgi:hypothetical protein